jgi:hypothetical protein
VRDRARRRDLLGVAAMAVVGSLGASVAIELEGDEGARARTRIEPSAPQCHAGRF